MLLFFLFLFFACIFTFDSFVKLFLKLIYFDKNCNMFFFFLNLFQASKKHVCGELERTMSQQLTQVAKAMAEAYRTFERCLSKGVESSICSYGQKLKTFLYYVCISQLHQHKELCILYDYVLKCSLLCFRERRVVLFTGH